MKHFTKLNLVMFGLSLCFLIGLAQDKAATASPDNKVKPATIKTIYDKAKDETVVVLMPTNVIERPGSVEAIFPADGAARRRLPSLSLLMTAYFSYPGKTLVAPRQVVFGFMSLSENEIKFANDRDLTVIADGTQLGLGEMKVVDRRVDSGIQGGDVTFYREELELAVAAETFQRIANAAKVTVRLGKNEFELPAKQRVSLRALSNRMQG